MKSHSIARTVFLLLFLGSSASAQLANRIELTEDNRLLGLGTRHVVRSDLLQEERPVIISLPASYESNASGYPVLYLLDGRQNIKHQIGTVELLTESGLVPPLIIVAIESLDRSRDLTPSNAGQNVYGGTGQAGIPQSGGAPMFLDFLANELIPWVEANFRTHPFRILEGHSLGGLFSVYALMEKPELFDAVIVQSPALWWNNEEMTARAQNFFASNPGLEKSLYLGIGGGDGWGMRQELRRFVDVIEQHNPENLDWMHEEIGNEGHMDARLLLNYYGLKFVFSDLLDISNPATDFSEARFLASEQTLLTKYGETARRPVEGYLALYSQLVGEGNDRGAITVLTRASQAYPQYPMLLNNLAQLYEKTNQIEAAIGAYQRGVEVSKELKLGMEEGYQREIVRLKGFSIQPD